MKKTHYIYISFLAVSFICMLLITTSSPLYSVNISPDSNVMFTIGKSLWHGMLPYKDLFDQRGPLIYLINSIASLISYKSFTGIYIFESVLMFIDLLFIYKTLRIKFNSLISITSSLASIPFIFNSKLLTYGNTPEEYALPLIFITIYMLCLKSIEKWNNLDFYLMGLFLAITFWIKYTLSITWIALFIALFIISMLRKDYKHFINAVLYGLIGFITISVPLLFIYLINGALKSLFYVYFYLNLTSYQTHVNTVSKTFILLIIINLIFIFLVSKTFCFDKGQFLTISLITILTLIVLFCDSSNVPYYYFEIEYSFIIFPIITCYIYKSIHFKYIYIVITILILPLLFVSNKNYKQSNILQPRNQSIDINRQKNIPIQKEFANIVTKYKNVKILNYRNLDLGFYTYSGYVPKEKYFMWNNMNYKPMQDDQNNYLKSLKYNFIIIRYDIYPTKIKLHRINNNIVKTIKSKYSIIDKRTVLFEGGKETYVIYKIKQPN